MAGAAEQLWKEYAFYCKELVKFLNKQDSDMFTTLNQELEKTRQKIAALPEDDFVRTPPGQALLQEAAADVRYLMQGIRRWQNALRRQGDTAKAYDFLGVQMSGNRLNFKG